MIKRIILLIVAMLIILSVGYSQPSQYCQYITCPGPPDFPGVWTPAETGWVLMKIGYDQYNNPVYCIVKICYCYYFGNEEDPHFFIKKINYWDPLCIINNPVNPEVLKLSAMTEFIRIHMNEMDIRDCPDYAIEARLYTSFCYFDYMPNGIDPVSSPCTDSYCYKYCWETIGGNKVLKVEKLPIPPVQYWYTDCELPILGPMDVLLNGCIPYCEWEE